MPNPLLPLALRRCREDQELSCDERVIANSAGARRSYAAAMLKTGGGSIVNMASILGATGFAMAPAYTAAKHGVDHLITLGELATHSSKAFGLQDKFGHAADFDALLQQLLPEAHQFSTIAVKGSRFMRMERAVQALQIAHQPRGGQAC